MSVDKFTLTAQQLRHAIRMYGFTLGLDQTPATTSGYRNTSYVFSQDWTSYNLLVYGRSDTTRAHIDEINRVGELLSDAGLPVRRPADARILRLHSGPWRRYVALYGYLPGHTISWEAYTMKHMKLLGWALADFHGAANAVADSSAPRAEDAMESAVERIRAYFTPEVTAAVQRVLKVSLDPHLLDHLNAFCSALRILPDAQLLHMDFVRGNILFDHADPESRWAIDSLALTGILDLEKIAVGHPLVDIARSLAFLITDCSNKTEAQIRRYFLQSGYIRRGQSQVKPISVILPSQVKCDVLESCLSYFWLYDFYKFLRSNPYESLAENYHYCRTRDILLQKNLLHYM